MFGCDLWIISCIHWPVNSADHGKLKDLSRSRAISFIVEVVISQKRCKLKKYTACRIAQFSMTLSDIQGYSPIASLFNCDPSIVQQSVKQLWPAGFMRRYYTSGTVGLYVTSADCISYFIDNSWQDCNWQRASATAQLLVTFSLMWTLKFEPRALVVISQKRCKIQTLILQTTDIQ